MPTPLILGPFAHTSLLPMARPRVLARRELITVVMSLLSSEESNQLLSESDPGWSSGCSGFSSGSVSPTWKGNTEESVGHSIFANKLPNGEKSFKLSLNSINTAEEGGCAGAGSHP